MRLGAPTLMEMPNARENAAFCREMGLDFWELNANSPRYLPSEADARQLRALSKEFGIQYTIHMDDAMDIGSFNPFVAKAYLDTTLQTVALARELNALRINMHLNRGPVFTLPEGKCYPYAVDKDRYLRTVTQFRDAVDAAVGDAPLQICVENTDGFQDYQLEALEILLESGVFGLTLDVGHQYCSGAEDESFILAHRHRLHHIHLHDAQEGKDHLPLGKGRVELSKYLALGRDCDCTVLLEIKTAQALQASVAWIKENWAG